VVGYFGDKKVVGYFGDKVGEDIVNHWDSVDREDLTS